MIPIIDGHNDILSRSWENEGFDFVKGSEPRHLTLDTALEAGLRAGLFAIFIPPNKAEEDRPRSFGGKLSTAGAVPLERAQRVAAAMFSRLHRYAEVSDGRFRIARTAHELEAAASGDYLAGLCHMEGAEPIDRGLHALDLYYQAGLRSLGIVWSRTNRFATGVPFGFDMTPDIGPGLTEAGRELVRRCNELGILIDVSHLNEKGFRDVVRISRAPVVASHSNAWALSKSTRNLTDEQLAAIRDTDGLVGLNFGVPFLRSDGGTDENTPVDRMREHVDYLVEHLGIDRVALGSDFDGVTIPKEIGSVKGLPRLIEALRAAGYSAADLEKIAYRNWLRVLQASIG
ncbi:MAG: dipeptidase [Spirochaetaceae bacterium]